MVGYWAGGRDVICCMDEGLRSAWTTVQSGKSRTGAGAKLRQPGQQEGVKKANSPQFKHIDHGGLDSSVSQTFFQIIIR